MNLKYAIATVAIISLIALASFVYVSQQGETAEQIEALHNLVDDTGHVTSMDAFPNKIVSVAPSITEIVFALGLDEKIVAVSDYCDYPYNFSAWIAGGNLTSIGAFDNPNMEVIISLEPDLILATGGVQQETVETLRALDYKVLVLNPADVDGILKNIELVGNATGKIAEAKALNDNIDNRISAVVNKVADAASTPKVYYELYYATGSSWTIGSLAYQNELIEKAGGINLFEDQQEDYYQYQVEALIARNPDVILLPASGMGTGGLQSLDDVKKRPGWDTTNAVKNDRLYQIDSDIIELAGPRVADAIEQLAEFFHP